MGITRVFLTVRDKEGRKHRLMYLTYRHKKKEAQDLAEEYRKKYSKVRVTHLRLKKYPADPRRDVWVYGIWGKK